MKVISETVLDFVNQLRVVRNDKKILSSREQKIRAEILGEIGEVSQELVTPSGLVVGEVVVYEQRKMDWDLLATKYPQAYADCVSSGEVVRLDTK